MPYRTVADLPEEQVRDYSPKQRRAFLHAFNRAVREQGLSEDRAFAVAHTAAKRAGAGRRPRVRRKRR